MRKIEELLFLPQNRERYEAAKSDLLAQKLVVFFGAGLSLGGEMARKWGGPFEEVCNQLIKSKCEFENFIANRERSFPFPGLDYAQQVQTIEKGKTQLGQISHMLSETKELLSKKRFLEAGDQLSEILKIIQETCNKWAITERIEDIVDKNFNDLIADIMNDLDYSEVDEIYDSPYKISALFFLPYIGNALITTNIDMSFEKVNERLEVKQSWHKILARNDVKIETDWEQTTNRIFYIHGHVKKPDSLIMTKKEYDDMYPKFIPANGEVYGARELLGKIVQEKSILFLGASLNQDRTVEIINLETQKASDDRRIKKLSYFPIVGANAAGMISAPPGIKNTRPIIYSENEYQEIMLILLQLIRDTDERWEKCKWVEPSSKFNLEDIPDEVKNDLIQFLSPDDCKIYDEIDIPDGVCAFKLVHYLYQHHSVYKHDSGLGWNICCVTENEFTLGKCEKDERFSPLHNYPIGDTICVLYSEPQNKYGESTLYKDEAKRIKKELEQWRSDFFPFYAGKSGENCFNGFSPRIRLIIFPLCDSPRKQYENIKNIIREIDKFLERLRSANENVSVPILSKLEELLGILFKAISRDHVAEKNAEINSSSDELLHHNTKILQRKLNMRGDEIEQNLQ